MNYNILGRTGMKVSEIGIGCEGFVDKNREETAALLNLALDEGINYMDLYSSNPEVRSNLGFVLKQRRKEIIMQAHLCSVWENGQYKRTRNTKEVKIAFQDLLNRLQTDYIDVGMIHYVDALTDWEAVKSGPIMEYAQQLKKDGIIKAIGVSSHNPEVGQAIAESNLVDVIMFSINPCYDLQPATESCEDLWDPKNYQDKLVNMEPVREKFYETCQAKNIAITVMKPYGGGDLLNAQYSPAGKALTVLQCLHYALNRPAVATVLPGAHTAKELREALAYEKATSEEKDYATVLASFPKISWKGHCMYCTHCAPCPQGLDVAMITKFLNLAKAQGQVPETVREHYEALAHKGGECISCHSCETRCPFGVDIVTNMAEAKKVFGS